MTDPDKKRLGVQREDVLRIMLADGEWLTFEEIQRSAFGRFNRLHPEASISARLRDLRLPRYGSYIVDRRPRRGSLNEYRVTLRPKSAEVQIGMFEEARA